MGVNERIPDSYWQYLETKKIVVNPHRAINGVPANGEPKYIKPWKSNALRYRMFWKWQSHVDNSHWGIKVQ